MVSDERGQLILVGAIAIALVVLGLVLIVNTALFTQIVGSEGTVESAKEGGVSGQEIGDAIGAVVAEENRNGGGVSTINSSTADIVEDRLQPALAERSIEGSGAFVSLEYTGSAEDGVLVKQDDNSGLDDGQLVSDGDIGEFVLTIDTAASAIGEEFYITIDDGTSPKNLTVNVDSSNEISLSGADEENCSAIEPTDGTVRIDIDHGLVFEDSDCEFDLYGDTQPSYDVSLTGGGDVNANYVLVTNGTSPVSSSSVIWSFEYAFKYDSNDATVRSDRREVDVYD